MFLKTYTCDILTSVFKKGMGFTFSKRPYCACWGFSFPVVCDRPKFCSEGDHVGASLIILPTRGLHFSLIITFVIEMFLTGLNTNTSVPFSSIATIWPTSNEVKDFGLSSNT